VTAGYPVNATVLLVDAYFNVVAQNAGVTFSLDDVAAPQPTPLQILSGTGQESVRFVTLGNHVLTAGSSDLGLPAAHSSVLNVLGGFASTLLNVVHGAPKLTTVVKGQLGAVLMNLDLSVGSGTDPIQLDQCVLETVDGDGKQIPASTAFSSLYLTDGAVTLGSAGLGSSSVTFSVPLWTWSVDYGNPIHLRLVGDIAGKATADNLRLVLPDPSSMTAHDPVTLTTQNVGIAADGDPTGFPMRSSLLTLRNSSLADTYGNYPNPFRAGLESTTFEFYLASPGTADLILYDSLGRVVKRLLSGVSLLAGLQRVRWDGHNGNGTTVVNGVYFARLTVGGTSLVIKTAVSK
jgi:hypothetical protein